MECLRYWVSQYRVDGFRFDLASILGRSEDGSPMSNPPLLKRLAFDPLLGSTKLIAEAWDAGGLYQVGRFPAWKRWAEWNGKYRDTLRSFLKGEYWLAPEAARRITGSHDLYGAGTGGYSGYNSSVNFLTCHDGFTLRDLYSYNEKHNEANGWNNTDGANDNRSWNCGAEGETDDPEVKRLRLRLMKNACAVLMCSRGTPMFLAGDEFGNTQYGNNNAYCQDNEISWLDWSLLEKNQELYEFFRFLIAFRKGHPAVTRELPGAMCGFPPISCHKENAWDGQLNSDTKAFSVMYAGYDAARGCDDLVLLAVNPWWEEVWLSAPALPEGYAWRMAVCTGAGEAGEIYSEGKSLTGERICLKPRSVAVLYGHSYFFAKKN